MRNRRVTPAMTINRKLCHPKTKGGRGGCGSLPIGVECPCGRCAFDVHMVKCMEDTKGSGTEVVLKLSRTRRSGSAGGNAKPREAKQSSPLPLPTRLSPLAVARARMHAKTARLARKWMASLVSNRIGEGLQAFFFIVELIPSMVGVNAPSMTIVEVGVGH